MGNAYELYAEDSNFNHVARFDAMQQGVAEQVVFVQFALGQSGCEV